jgi:hypothetical protein
MERRNKQKCIKYIIDTLYVKITTFKEQYDQNNNAVCDISMDLDVTRGVEYDVAHALCVSAIG